MADPELRRNATTAVGMARRAFAAGDVSTAERICREVLSTAPYEGGVWILLTETALRRDRPDAAMVCADRAIALMPHDPLALVLRAKCLFVIGEPQLALNAAEAASQAAASQLVTSAEILDALGAMFGLLGQHRRAEKLLRLAIDHQPDVPQYLFNLAATERILGKFGAAEANCDAAISINRHYPLAHYLRSDLRMQTPDRNHVAEMKGLIAEGGLGRQGEILLRFALGKELEDLGEYSHAFDQIAAGCALQRSAISYDVGKDVNDIGRIIAAHTKASLAVSPAGYCDAAPIFVVGLPRTGTTLAERIIAGHSALTSVGETGAFAGVLHRALKASDRVDFIELGRQYITSTAAFAAPLGERFIDKTLTNYLYCALIHTALPRAKIVLVHRRPLDTCWAIYKTLFQGHFLFSYDQVELAEYYLSYRHLARHWRAVLPQHAFLEVNYEDLVNDQRASSRRLIEFVGLPWEDDVLRFHENQAASATASAVQVRRPIYTSSIGKWQHYGDRLKPLFERLLREIPPEELI